MIVVLNLFYITVLLVFLGIFPFLVKAGKSQSDFSSPIFSLSLFVELAILFCIASEFIQNLKVASLLWGFYCITFDFALYYFIQLIYVMENHDLANVRKSFITKIYSVGTGIDICLVILNVTKHWYFDLQPHLFNDSFLCWRISYHKAFLFHICICYIAVFTSIFVLVNGIVRVKAFYRSRSRVLLVALIITVGLNGLFVVFSEKWLLDFSILSYGIFGIFVLSFLLYSVPKKIKKNLLSIATDNISDAVICFDYKGNCIYKNHLADIFYRDDDNKGHWLDWYLNNSSDYVMKAEEITVDGKDYIVNVEFKRMYDKKNRFVGSYIRVDDRTAAVHNMELEEYKATHDELTGLYTRSYFFSEVERILRETPEIPRYFVCTNIKDFKIVNDLFGSEFGDKVLAKQAEMLTMAKYDGVIYGRISGDKFAMLIPKVNFNPVLAEKNSKNILNSFTELNFKLKVFIGVYEISNPYENVHAMYDKANLAIKNGSANSDMAINFYDTSILNSLVRENQVISEFNYAIKEGQFCMFLQSQINTKTLECIGAEALVRWYDSNQIYRHPSEFINVLEKGGLIYRLDCYIWDLAAKKLQEWKKNGFEDYYISVNISAKDFYCDDLYSVFVNLVEKYNVSPKSLKLEITESILIEERNTIKPVLRKLKDYGFCIEMDDFGSGYSSLSVLKDIPVDVLKIDMGFLRKTENEQRGRLIITAIVKMAKELGMTVVTEGVEEEEQAAFLAFIGVDVFQGYLYSKPLAVYDFEHKYQEEKK